MAWVSWSVESQRWVFFDMPEYPKVWCEDCQRDWGRMEECAPSSSVEQGAGNE